MKNRGFTLLEVIIYIALFAIIMGGAFTAAYSLLEGAERHYTALSVQEEGTFINRKLNWELTNATSIHTQGLHGVRIEPGSVVFAGAGSGITIKRGTGSTLVLSSGAHKIEDVDFTVIAASGGKPASLRASYTIDGKPFSFAKYLRQ